MSHVRGREHRRTEEVAVRPAPKEARSDWTQFAFEVTDADFPARLDGPGRHPLIC
ncbi:hypothetical protein K4749_38725 [Streptomyces sp. TRM72054]|uniref:hypothetical protein n=1 Tax=Streptomyces sp. TRM72054 TaxID=2870562 RepID=UPI001C8CC78B|nr:hypothetical protein [Streptomyces sp. TRM72054]MBX9399332.1 hypothetical protein [Streptomyces sp. TRM72054]